MYELLFDGLFRKAKDAANAGFMCFGWLIYRHEHLVGQGDGAVGRGVDATSNIAEYLALIDGLQALSDMGVRGQPVRVVGDARVVINQMKGISKINTPVHRDASKSANTFHNVEWLWVPRKKNKAADRLTRRALQEFLSDKAGFRQARATVLRDNKARRNRILNLGGMMVFGPQPAGR